MSSERVPGFLLMAQWQRTTHTPNPPWCSVAHRKIHQDPWGPGGVGMGARGVVVACAYLQVCNHKYYSNFRFRFQDCNHESCNKFRFRFCVIFLFCSSFVCWCVRLLSCYLVCLLVCLSVCVYVCLSVCLSVFICLSACLLVCFNFT